MTAYPLGNPLPTFTALSGLALNGGSIYIGLPNQDPQTNPKQVYWDAAETIPASQPLDTLGGYVWRLGDPAVPYVSGAYSIRVLDRLNVEVFYEANATDQLQDFITTLATSAGAGLLGFSQTATYPDDTVGKHLQAYIDPTDAPYNAVADGVEDDLAAILAAMATGRPIRWGGPERVYRITDTLTASSRQVWYFEGATIRMDHSGRGYVRPLLNLQDGADYSHISGVGTLDHDASDVLMAYMTTPVAIGFLSAVVVQADFCTITSDVSVINAWDNGVYVGRFSITGSGTTGDRYAATATTGLPVGAQVTGIRAKDCGIGYHDPARVTTPGGMVAGYQGAGINNGSGTRTVVTDNVIEDCATGLVSDYGAGAGGVFDGNIVTGSVAATGNEGWGGWFADGPSIVSNNQFLFCDGDGLVIAPESGQTVVSGNTCYGNGKHGLHIASAKTILSNNLAEANGQATANTYDGFFLNSDTESLDNVVLTGCSGLGTQQRYGISASGANGITAQIIGGRYEGATGQASFGSKNVAVLGQKTSAGTLGVGMIDPNFPWEVTSAVASYLTNPLGDSDNNGTLAVSSKTERDFRLAFGCDSVNGVAVIQAIFAGVAKKPLLLNPSGGDVMAGGSSWTTGHMRLGAYHLWVDSSGRLRIKSSAPSSDTDGTIVGTQS